MAKKSNGDPGTTLAVRMPLKDLDRFKSHCQKKLLRPYQEVLKEMMTALVDSRLHITPTEDQKNSTGDLYNVN